MVIYFLFIFFFKKYNRFIPTYFLTDAAPGGGKLLSLCCCVGASSWQGYKGYIFCQLKIFIFWKILCSICGTMQWVFLLALWESHGSAHAEGTLSLSHMSCIMPAALGVHLRAEEIRNDPTKQKGPVACPKGIGLWSQTGLLGCKKNVNMKYQLHETPKCQNPTEISQVRELQRTV